MTLFYVVKEGTDNRWCYDLYNEHPRHYDSSEIAQEHIDRASPSVPHVPISVDEYEAKYVLPKVKQ